MAAKLREDHLDGEAIPPSRFFFDGCSWGVIYYAGVYDALWKHFAPSSLAKMHWGGCSSGAFLALAGAMHKDPTDMRKLYHDLAHVASIYGVFGWMSVYHEMTLLNWLPDGGDEWQRLNGRLFVGITRPVAHFEMVSEWSSNKELRDTMHASMHIPYYMTHLATVKGRWALDGCLSFRQAFRCGAVLDEQTVVVGSDPSFGYDICPTTALSLAECYTPADLDRLAHLVALGEADGTAWCRGERRTDKPTRSRMPLQHRVLCFVLWWLRSVEQHGRWHAFVVLFGWWLWRRRR